MTQQAVAWLDGRFLPLDQARISPLDRGFLFADGIYEILPCYGGQLFSLDLHLDRLIRSLAAIRLTPAQTRDDWAALLSELAAHNGGGDLGLYLQVTRGTAPQRMWPMPSAIRWITL